MKKYYGAVAGIFAAIALQGLCVCQADAATTAVSSFKPSSSPFKQRADIDPSSTINAFVRFTDDGTTLTVTGRGFGFDPNLAFVSLIYADPSFSRGALACLPPTPNPFSPPQMFVAYWIPVSPGSSERTLSVAKTGAAYVPLLTIDTISVRYDSTPGVGNPANSVQTPGRYFLQSCGRVK